MIGAVLGDIAGSRFEFKANRVRPTELFTSECSATDDTYLACAVADALTDCVRKGTFDGLREAVLKRTLETFEAFPGAGWGTMFFAWAKNLLAVGTKGWKPNRSAGNGCASKVASIPYFAQSLKQCKELTHVVTSVTHDHEESYKAAECVTTSMFLALEGKTRDIIRQNIISYYPEAATLSYEGLNRTYQYSELARDTVPAAMVCFLESDSFEDALMRAISIGGDADTLGAITGGLAESFYWWTQEAFLRYSEMLDPHNGYGVPVDSILRVTTMYLRRNPQFFGVRK